jgi:hypothetical protein
MPFMQLWPCYLVPEAVLGKIGKAVRIRHVPNAVMGTV